MASQKSDMRTVLLDSVVNSSSYASGALSVGDLHFLLIDVKVTAVTYIGGLSELHINRIDANGDRHLLSSGAVETHIVSSGSVFALNEFNDQIEVVSACAAGNSATFVVSIQGR